MTTDVLGITQAVSGAFFNSQEFLGLLKVGLVIVQVIYVFFAFVVVRQVVLMNRTFKTGAGFIFSIISWVHFFATILLILLTIILI